MLHPSLRSLALVPVLAVFVVACEGPSPGDDERESAGQPLDDAPPAIVDDDDGELGRDPDEGGPQLEPDAGPIDAPALDAGPAALPFDECLAGVALCTGWNVRRACADTASGTRFVEETCGEGEGCFAGACTPGRCSDECGLDDVNGAEACRLYDVAAGQWPAAEPSSSMHDRARAYSGRVWREHYKHAGLGHARYADPGTWQELIQVRDIGDSALHTGEYIAGEALRLMATGAPDAREAVVTGVRGMNILMNISGYPGVLARHAIPEDAPDLDQLVVPGEQYDCAQPSTHCDVPHEGTTWRYLGHVSRDMYQGVMLGYGLAYDALTPADDDVRELIRHDVVELVEELMKERTMPLRFTYNGIPLPKTDITTRFVVVVGNELDEEGASLLSYGEGGGHWRGFQEFIPQLSDVTDQIMGPLSPPSLPRPGSAIMLTSFFVLALHVTGGVPAYAERRAAIEDFFLHNSGTGGNVDDWLDVAGQWLPDVDGDNGCGGRWYGNNLTMQPLYNWARIESDPWRSDFALDLLEQRARPAFAPTKNVFFSFLIEGLARTVDAGHASMAAAQLEGFGPPPRSRVAMNLLDDERYQAREPGCGDQLAHDQAVDVADRLVDVFLWQNHPWDLYFDGDPGQTYAGGDYLVAYWLGREHGFLDDDRPTTCARWQ